MPAKALATDFDADGIRVNCVAPSIVEHRCPAPTSGSEKGFEGQPFPVHRPEEVAAAVCYLASDLARSANGTTHVLDFGALARSAFLV
ncbi:SDR family oxidoreductase [Streptomyces sp. NPDC058086]|uniref:SDR family oxidoreductase n=1 Tax=Streptomyces sp. NPDC058086 TaxID=3346334 RepID=UPI0036EB54D9